MKNHGPKSRKAARKERADARAAEYALLTLAERIRKAEQSPGKSERQLQRLYLLAFLAEERRLAQLARKGS